MTRRVSAAGWRRLHGIAPVLDDLRIAAIFLTRLPIRPPRAIGLGDLAASVYMFPVVGLLLGLAAALVTLVAAVVGLPQGPTALLGLTTLVLLTGALHEDGLADTADALGVGEDRERALAVMRDSRIGAWGAVALGLSLLLRASALAALPDPASLAAALVAAAAVSRAAMPVVMHLQPSARAQGLAAGAGRPERERVLTGLAVAAVAALVLLPLGTAVGALLATALAAALVARHLGRRFGGCTGDTLGAVQQVAETVFLLAAAAR